MAELCSNLLLSIWREDDPDPKEKDREQIRVKLVDDLQMIEAEVFYRINQIDETKTPHRSHRYFVREAVVIALRQVVSEAFRQGMITDSLGTWTISKPKTKALDEGFDIDLDGALL